jgi:hydroxymethylpyrimidine pyrophosphatase-like HAD family hydrolase
VRYLLLATDYDGTLASHAVVSGQTVSVLRRVQASGRKLVLVTGRHMPDLKNIFPQLDLFHRVVAENGALLYRPSSHDEKLLCEPASQEFLELLRERQVPFTAGRGVVATWEPQQEAVLGAIHDLGLELQVIFNKGAVMVLPSGVNKGTGLKAALEELGISFHNVVGIGDAENDHALLSACECGVAVDNALPFLKQRADIVTRGRNGAGVVEIAERLLSDDLAEFDAHLVRHSVLLGERPDSGPVRILPTRSSILVTGPSASGKSTVVAGLLEQLVEQQYQFCLIDPEGDYENLTGALTFGTAKESPDPRAVLKALEMPKENVTVNLLAVPVGKRPEFFSKLLPGIQDLRARRARPHWLIVDEAHHLLPSSWSPASTTIPQALEGTILVTVHPDHVSAAALGGVNAVIAVGRSPRQSLRSFAEALRIASPLGEEVELKSGEALVWHRQEPGPPVRVRTIAGKEDRRRHLRLYAEGELSPEQSFYFRGPDRKLNLRAQNLMMFIQLAEGVDESTWTYHLRRGDYSGWFREFVKDDELAANTAAIERDSRLSAEESRRRIKEMIQSRYTAPV